VLYFPIQNLTSSLLSNEQLKLQGLVEIGSCALKTLCAQWSQQDKSSAESARDKMRFLVEQSKKKGDDLHKIEGNLKAMCDKLDLSVKKVYQHLQAPVEDNKLTKPYRPHGQYII
jgi:polyhydroxyalkanoate synthesis regulator phasin